MPKERLDVLLVERGLATSREAAQRLIRAGQVEAAGTVAGKPGHRFETEIELSVKERPRYVGRGGQKLEAGLAASGIVVAGRSCLDAGSSTGGFVDCLLQYGAARVVAVDVGKGQLHWKLRSDPRVTVMEGVNARYLKRDDLPYIPDLATVDVAFISLTRILPSVTRVLAAGADLVTLIKPQFEAGREFVERGGVVRDEQVRADVICRIRSFGCEELGLAWRGVCESPLRGPAGNVEFLAWWQTPAGSPGNGE